MCVRRRPRTRDDKAGNATDKPSDDHWRPDTGRAWLVAVVCMANSFLQLGLYRTLGLFVVELMEIYDAPVTRTALIFSCVAVGFGVTSILYIFGIGDIVHERALVAASSFLAFLGFTVTFFSSRTEHVCVQGFCTGASMQIGITSGLSLVGQYFDKRRTVANGIVMCGSSLGVLAFPPVIQWLLEEYTYRGTALICAGLTLNSLVCCFLMTPVPRTIKPEKVSPGETASGSGIKSSTAGFVNKVEMAESHLSETAAATITDVSRHRDGAENIATNSYDNGAYLVEMEGYLSESQKEVTSVSTKVNAADVRRSAGYFEAFRPLVRKFTLKDTGSKPMNASFCRSLLPSASLLKHPALPFLQLFVIFSTVGSESVIQFYPASTRELGMSEYKSAFLLSIAGVGDLLSSLGLTFIADYNFMARYKLVAIVQFVLGTACFLSRFATEFWSQGIFAVVVGLTFSTGYVFRAVILIDFFGLPEVNRLMGLSNFVSSLGYIAGGPFIGYLRDLTGDYEVPFQTIGALLLAGGLCLLLSGMCKWHKGRKRGQYDVN